MYLLNDAWAVEGTSPSEFFGWLKKLDEETNYFVVNTRDVQLLSPWQHSTEELVFQTFNEEDGKMRIQTHRFPFASFAANDAASLFDEIKNNRLNLIRPLGEDRWVCRPLGLNELMIAVGLRGDAVVHQSRYRDLYLDELIKNSRGKVTLITRSENGYTKVFSVRTDRYQDIPLQAIEDLYRCLTTDAELGTMQCVHWKVDHDFAEIQFEFPDLADEFTELYHLPKKIVPGLRILSSGTGYSCMTVAETWRLGSTTSVAKIKKRKHIGNWDAKVFFEETKKEILSQYTVLPERLLELFGLSISTDAKQLTEIVRETFKGINLQKVFYNGRSAADGDGRKNYLQQLTKEVVEDLMTKPHLTFYDVATAIMELPSTTRMDIPVSYRKRFADACGRAAFCPFEDMKDLYGVDDEPLRSDALIEDVA